MPDRDDLDSLLDAALNTYADPGPSSGLEHRVLARISTQNTPVWPRWRLHWAALAAVPAGLVLMFILAPWRHVPPHIAPKAVAPAVLPMTASTVTPETPPPGWQAIARVTRTADRVSPQPAAPPKLDIFPAPTPLSKQEQALVRFVTQTSETQHKDFMEAQQQAAAPLRIASISIPPIEPPVEGKE
jgi:hypothetical protein